MNRIKIIVLLFFMSSVSFGQSNDKFLFDFMLESELKKENELKEYNRFDFSKIWTKTKNNFVYGIIGDDHQRIKIKLISINRNPSNPNEYLVSGKSLVKGTICDFKGKITLREIKQTQKLHYGVDAEYYDKGIKSQGILIADYEFIETAEQKHTGVFKGQLYSKWYLNSENQIEYDNIQLNSDGYTNNTFTGTWTSHSTGTEKICNWGDYRVPNTNRDFDIGAGQFSPNEKYYNKGWEIYQQAWLYGDEKAKKEELNEWWK